MYHLSVLAKIIVLLNTRQDLSQHISLSSSINTWIHSGAAFPLFSSFELLEVLLKLDIGIELLLTYFL